MTSRTPQAFYTTLFLSICFDLRDFELCLHLHLISKHQIVALGDNRHCNAICGWKEDNNVILLLFILALDFLAIIGPYHISTAERRKIMIWW